MLALSPWSQLRACAFLRLAPACLRFFYYHTCVLAICLGSHLCVCIFTMFAPAFSRFFLGSHLRACARTTIAPACSRFYCARAFLGLALECLRFFNYRTRVLARFLGSHRRASCALTMIVSACLSSPYRVAPALPVSIVMSCMLLCLHCRLDACTCVPAPPFSMAAPCMPAACLRQYLCAYAFRMLSPACLLYLFS